MYALFPPPKEGQPPYNPDIHPLELPDFKATIEEELREWQEDLVDGRETQKWRDEAFQVCYVLLRHINRRRVLTMWQASQDHVDGKFDQYKLYKRDQYWGQPADEGADEGVDDDAEEVGNDKKDIEVVAKTNGKGKAEEQVASLKTNGKMNGVRESSAASEEIKYGSEREIKDSEAESSEL